MSGNAAVYEVSARPKRVDYNNFLPKTLVHYSSTKVPLVGNSEQVFLTAAWALGDAGYYKIQKAMEECGQKFVVWECSNCGHHPATVFHCDQRLCPRCYYRQLLRFFRVHQSEFEEQAKCGLTSFTIKWGSCEEGILRDGLEDAQSKHKRLMKLMWRLRAGIYHREFRYDSERNCYHIDYHYLVAGKQSMVLMISSCLEGVGFVTNWKYFDSYSPSITYSSAYRHFIQEHCQYPSSVVCHSELIAEYILTLKNHKLIQGFGELYQVSGGLMRGKRAQFLCPFCAGETHVYMVVAPDRVVWRAPPGCYELEK